MAEVDDWEGEGRWSSVAVRLGFRRSGRRRGSPELQVRVSIGEDEVTAISIGLITWIRISYTTYPCLLSWNQAMGDGPRGVEIIADYFQPSTSGEETPQTSISSISSTNNEFEHSSSSRLWARRRLKTAASILNLLSPRRLSWVNDTNGQEKVVLSSAEVKSLQSELADLEEREAHLRAKLEHTDEILRSCHLSGYLSMRTRWETLPGEPLPLDDTEVDDWLPRFVVLHGPCIYLYFLCTDLSPQDSTLLSDIIEVGSMPHVIHEDGETRYYFYIVTRLGLRYECSSTSKIQVHSWLTALQDKCKLVSHTS